MGIGTVGDAAEAQNRAYTAVALAQCCTPPRARPALLLHRPGRRGGRARAGCDGERAGVAHCTCTWARAGVVVGRRPPIIARGTRREATQLEEMGKRWNGRR